MKKLINFEINKIDNKFTYEGMYQECSENSCGLGYIVGEEPVDLEKIIEVLNEYK